MTRSHPLRTLIFEWLEALLTYAQHYSPFWSYFPAFVVVILGLVIYFCHATRKPPNWVSFTITDNANANIAEEQGEWRVQIPMYLVKTTRSGDENVDVDQSWPPFRITFWKVERILMRMCGRRVGRVIPDSSWIISGVNSRRAKRCCTLHVECQSRPKKIVWSGLGCMAIYL